MIDLNKFDHFFILDLANNHQGDLKHALKIIDSFGKKINSLGIKATIKLQFRNLKTYLHSNSISEKNKYINRFKSTELSFNDYKKIVERIKKYNLFTMTTPFDEDSFDLIEKLEIDIIKIASVSSSDQTLLNKVKVTKKPVVISIGGQDIEQIDQIVNFFQTYTKNFVIQHCVAIYPTPNKDLELNQISFLTKRFPNVRIGFSTHEDPNNVDAIKIALSKGATFFERHIGLDTKNYKLNDYSSNLDQFSTWIKSYKETLEMLGAKKRKPISHAESSTLNLLSRGVYVKNNINANQEISLNNTYFAFPLQKNQISSSDFNINKYVTKKKILKDKPVFENLIEKQEKFNTNNHILNIMLQFKSMLTESMTPINADAQIELSHHYGIDRFREFGCLIITCFNYDYAKKLIILLPRQKHPYHFHKKKYETFQILRGDLEAEIDGNPKKLKPGDICTISAGQWHKFQTSKGAIFEEISTKHYNNDSFYKDPRIAKIDREIRKTKLTNWRDYFKNNF